MSRTIRIASLLLPAAALGFTAVQAGETAPPPKVTPPENPLSLWDGSLVIDFQERLRTEARENNRDFDSTLHDDNDDSWLLNRSRLGFTLKPGPWVKAYIQGQDSREWFSDRPKIPGVHSADGNDAFDLRQAYIQLGDAKELPLLLNVGRRSLQYGDRRLVADSLWSNTGRTFDQVTLRYETPKLWVDAFASRPVQLKADRFDDADAEDNFYGIYLSTTYVPHQTTDFYVLYRDKSDNQPDLSPVNSIDPRGSGTGPAARFTTIGTRFDSTPGELHGWDYNAEFAYQFGDLWETDRNSKKLQLHAFAAHVGVGYTFEEAAWKPRIGLEYNYASGDDNPADGRSSSFQNLYPGNHEKFGYMDEFSWRNQHDVRLQLKVKPTRKLELELHYLAYWLADTSDYWYRSNGLTALRTKTALGQDVRTLGASPFAGQEIDFAATYEFSKSFKLQGGYSHFFAGSYLRDTGAHDDADFGYLMGTLQF